MLLEIAVKNTGVDPVKQLTLVIAFSHMRHLHASAVGATDLHLHCTGHGDSAAAASRIDGGRLDASGECARVDVRNTVVRYRRVINLPPKLRLSCLMFQ